MKLGVCGSDVSGDVIFKKKTQQPLFPIMVWLDSYFFIKIIVMPSFS